MASYWGVLLAVFLTFGAKARAADWRLDIHDRAPDSNLGWHMALPNHGSLKTHPISNIEAWKAIDEVEATVVPIIEDTAVNEEAYIVTASTYLNYAVRRVKHLETFHAKWLIRTVTMSRYRDSPKHRLAGAIALAYLDQLAEFPHALEILVHEGLTHQSALVRTKAALALILTHSRRANQAISGRLTRLSSEVQDRTMFLLMDIVDETRWDPRFEGPCRKYVAVALRNNAHNQFVVRLVTEQFNLLEFTDFIMRRTGILQEFRIAMELEELTNRLILDEPILVVACAMYVTTQGWPETDPLLHLARQIVLDSYETALFPHGGPIQLARHRERLLNAIPPSLIRATYEPLLGAPDPNTRLTAAFALLGPRTAPHPHALSVLRGILMSSDFPDGVALGRLNDHVLQGSGLLSDMDFQDRVLGVLSRTRPSDPVYFHLSRLAIRGPRIAQFRLFAAAPPEMLMSLRAGDIDLHEEVRNALIELLFSPEEEGDVGIDPDGRQLIIRTSQQTDEDVSRTARLLLVVSSGWDQQRDFLIDFVEDRLTEPGEDRALDRFIWTPASRSTLPTWHVAAMAVAIATQSAIVEFSNRIFDYFMKSLASGERENEWFKFAYYALMYMAAVADGPSVQVLGRMERYEDDVDVNYPAAIPYLHEISSLRKELSRPSPPCRFSIMEDAPQVRSVIRDQRT